MSDKQALQAAAATAEQPVRPVDSSDRPLQFELIPNVCLIADVCHHLRISESQFFRLMDRRELALVELPKWDRRRRFTGESVARVIRMRGAR